MTLHVILRVAKVKADAKLPTRKYSGDAGMDFYCLFDTIIPPHKFKVVRTGITVEIGEGYHGLLKPKGGNSHLVGAGVIENTYQGEILFKIFNPTDEQRVYAKGDAIGQMVLIPAYSPMPVECAVKDIHNNITDRESSGGIVKQLGE